MSVFEEKEFETWVLHRALELIAQEGETLNNLAFRECCLKGRTLAEVAKELGISVGKVYRAKEKVLQKLREDLQGQVDI